MHFVRVWKVWALTWAAGGGLLGLVLLLHGDTGHVPPWLLPLLLAVLAAPAGFLAGSLYAAVRATPRLPKHLDVLTGTAWGALTLALVHRPLGATLGPALVVGSALGLISALLSPREPVR